MSHRNKEKYEINQTNYTYRYYYNINDILCIKQDCTIKQCRCKQYKYVIFGSESSGDRELDDIIMAVQNQIAETNLKVLSTSNISKVLECSDSILTPNIHVTSEKWDGGHTYITVTFYDYNNNQRIAVVKSSGIGMTVSHDQNIALGAIRKKLDKLFKDN